MEKETKENKVIEFIHSLPMAWFSVLRDIFIFIMFIELGYLIYKTTGVEIFLILNMKLISIFIFGFVYLILFSLLVYVVYFFNKYLIPKLKERQEKRKKEFFKELKKELKKK